MLRPACFCHLREEGREEKKKRKKKRCVYNVIKFDTARSGARIIVFCPFFKKENPFPLEMACFVKSLLSRDQKQNMHTNVTLPPLGKWLIWHSGNEAGRRVIEPSWIQVDGRRPVISLWFYLSWFCVFTLISNPQLQLSWNEVFI